MDSRLSRGLVGYMSTVIVLAAPVLTIAVVEAIGFFRAHGALDRRLLIIVLFAAVIVIAEMKPIPVARGENAGDLLTMATAFGFGLLFVAPVAVTVAAQVVGLVIVDGVLHRERRAKIVFNIAQYTLAYACARAAYAVIAGTSFSPSPRLVAPDLPAALAAGAVFLVINNVSVGLAVALHTRMRLGRVLVSDFRSHLRTSAPLIALGPVLIQAALWTPLSVPLLLLPIVALHHSGTTAMRREREALRDALTGLGNRSMMTVATERALADSVGVTAMLLIDLDHFKEINDTLGHAAGDQMLIAVADRLRGATHPEHHLVARLGGDEFVVLARGLDERGDAVELATALCAAVSEPVKVDGVTLTVGCSIGIAFSTGYDDTVSDLLRCADVALYEAKVARGTVAVYDPDSDGHSPRQLGMHADLRDACTNASNSQLWVAYQPQLDLRTGAVRSLECLVRWRHPKLGDIAPDDLIPIAESTSLIDALFSRVLDTALRELTSWDDAGLHFTLSVNISARQLGDVALPGLIAASLKRHDLRGDRLVLEVTESRLMADPALSERVIGTLRGLGVEISIDDFGTGYSSLAHLQRLSVHELKIDKSFARRLDDPGNLAIVQSTIDLGHKLGLRVVAEGVESLGAAERLGRMGCDVLQGYAVGAPVAPSDVPELVSAASRIVPDSAPNPRDGGDRLLDAVGVAATPAFELPSL